MTLTTRELHVGDVIRAHGPRADYEIMFVHQLTDGGIKVGLRGMHPESTIITRVLLASQSHDVVLLSRSHVW